MRASLLLPVFALFASSAQACPSSSSVLFSCTIRHSTSRLEVCDTHKTISYSYGKPGKKPDLFFVVPRSQATTDQWEGFGPMTYTVVLKNKGFEYIVQFGSSEPGGEDEYPGISAGVIVFRGQEHIVSRSCDPNTAKSALEGIDLPKTP